MNVEFSLDGKRAVFAVVASVALVILIFLTGLLSGIMMIPDKAWHKESVTSPRSAPPSRPQIEKPASPQVAPLPARPMVSLPLPAQEPKAAVSKMEGEKSAKEQEMKSVVEGTIPKSPPPKQEPVVEKPPEPKETKPAGKMVWSVQAGAFLNKNNAEGFVSYLKGKGYSPYMRQLLDQKNRTWYSVRIADCEVQEEAARIASEFRSKEKMPAIVTHMDSLTGAKLAPSPPGDTVKQPEGASSPEKVPSPKQGGTKAPEVVSDQKMIYLVRVSSFRVENNALKVVDSLKEKGYDASIMASRDDRGKLSYTVILGQFEEREKAYQMASEFTKKEKIGAFVDPMRLFQLEKMKKRAQDMTKTEALEPAEAPEKREPVKTPPQKPPEVKTQ